LKKIQNKPKKTRQRRFFEEDAVRRKRRFTPAESLYVQLGGHITDEDVMAMLAMIMKRSGATMETLNPDMEDDFSTECLESLIGSLEIDFDALPPAAAPIAACPTLPVTGTRKITIRIPNRILASCKARAHLTGGRYQTLIVRTLNAASREWAA
jgi:hypothetical protein